MSVPIYRSIAHQIHSTWVNAASAREGDKLPTERMLELHFQVSRSTISRALSVLVAEGAISVRQGSGAYIARQCQVNSPKIVAFIAPYLGSAMQLENSILNQLQFSIAVRAAELGWQMVSLSSGATLESESAAIDTAVGLNVVGILCHPLYFGNIRPTNPLFDPLCRNWRKTPIICLDIADERWGRSIVKFDNRGCGFEVTTALLGMGNRNIVIMGVPPDSQHASIRDRMEGWKDAMDLADVPIPQCYMDFPGAAFPYVAMNKATSEDVASAFMALTPRPDTLICYDDRVAMLLIPALQKLGLSVPDDVLVIGFDNDPRRCMFQPEFPSSYPDFGAMGEMAMRYLEDEVKAIGMERRTCVLPVQTDIAHHEVGSRMDGTLLEGFASKI